MLLSLQFLVKWYGTDFDNFGLNFGIAFSHSGAKWSKEHKSSGGK